MNARKLPVYLVRALAPPRVAAGVLFTLALLSAACSDTPTNPSSRPTFGVVVGGVHDPSAAASGFAVLANQAVTCTGAATGPGSITGDVGTNLAPPTGSVTLTTCPVTGSVHVGDALATAAFNSFKNAYLAQAPGMPGAPVCTTALTGTLDGQNLPPGVYCFDAAAAPTGVLTLTGPADGIWIFQIGTGGTGALSPTDFSVVMAGGGQQCNVTWWVAEAATVIRGDFKGNILAGADITVTGPGTLNGNLYALADVTNSYMTVIGCAASQGNGNGQGKSQSKCNQGVGNGHETCDPGNSNNNHGSNDENGGTPGNPGRKGGH